MHESLKNMLLVMSASEVFKPGSVTASEDIWKLSWDKIDAFCPSLKLEFEEVLAKVGTCCYIL